MPAPLLSKPEMLGRLIDLFRDRGSDGASMSDISASTGLGKSSLYHHFPNGKEEIALQVLTHLEEQLERARFEPMRATAAPKKKLDRMLDMIDSFYEGGKKACAPLLVAQVEIEIAAGDLDRGRLAADELARVAAVFESKALAAGALALVRTGTIAVGDTVGARGDFQAAVHQ